MQKTTQVHVPFPLPQQRILLALAELSYATNVQLCRRWYKAGCIANIWRSIAELERRKLITHQARLLSRSEDGPAQRIYHLTATGRRAAELLGSTATRLVSLGERKYLFQEHILLVNEIHCALYEWEREGEGIEVMQALHDFTLKRDPLILTEEGKAITVVPDSWFHLRTDGTDRRFWVEADRGTEDEEGLFRRKIRHILLATVGKTGGKAVEKWGGTGCRVLFVVSPEDPRHTQRRMERVLSWIEKELTAIMGQDAGRFGPLFLVAGLDPAGVSGTSLFTAPYFVSPFERTPRAVVRAPA